MAIKYVIFTIKLFTIVHMHEFIFDVSVFQCHKVFNLDESAWYHSKAV